MQKARLFFRFMWRNLNCNGKKTSLLLLFLFSFSILQAQQYHPMLDSVNIWSIAANFHPVKQIAQTDTCQSWDHTWNGKYYTDGDTLLNGKKYFKVFKGAVGMVKCITGYIREDTSTAQVFFLGNNTISEKILYDFSLSVGDSIFIDNSWVNDYFYLDSIGFITIPAGIRRVFYLNKPGSFSIHLIWIEGVGSQIHPFYNLGIGSSGGLFSINNIPQCLNHLYNYLDHSSTLLLCFEHSNKVYFDSCALQNYFTNPCIGGPDSCTYGIICGSVKEHNNISMLKISPNPSSGKLNVEIEVAFSEPITFSLIDLTGRKLKHAESSGFVYPGKNVFNLLLDNLENGFYFLECKSPSGFIYRKILIRK